MPSVTGRAVQVTAAGGTFEMVQKQFPEPAPGQVRIRVKACGVCHSDSITKQGLFPGIAYPRVPGHEIAGVIDAVGSGEHLFKVGQRVGLGWHGGHCNYCIPCRRGDFILCENGQISGISFDGGYADYVVAPANAVAFMPDELKDEDAGPLLCAGITTYNSLRNSGARPGDTVAILGIGGLQLVVLGIIGEYLGGVFDEVKRRPLYIVNERISNDEYRVDRCGRQITQSRAASGPH